MVASNTDSLRLFVRMLADQVPPHTAEPPPNAVIYAHELVRRGIGLDVLLRGYHATEAAFFANFVARVHADPHLAPDAASVIEEAALWLFAFVGALTRGIVERYADESARWIRSAAASRLRDVQMLLADERIDPQAMSARLRYPLDRTHVAIVVWPTPQPRPRASLFRRCSSGPRPSWAARSARAAQGRRARGRRRCGLAGRGRHVRRPHLADPPGFLHGAAGERGVRAVRRGCRRVS